MRIIREYFLQLSYNIFYLLESVNTKLDPAKLEQTQLALSIHADIDRRYPHLKHQNLNRYIQTIALRQWDEGFSHAVVIIPELHENRKTETENILKKLVFENRQIMQDLADKKKSLHIEVFWRDGSPSLWAAYGVKKPDKN